MSHHHIATSHVHLTSGHTSHPVINGLSGHGHVDFASSGHGMSTHFDGQFSSTGGNGSGGSIHVHPQFSHNGHPSVGFTGDYSGSHGSVGFEAGKEFSFSHGHVGSNNYVGVHGSINIPY